MSGSVLTLHQRCFKILPNDESIDVILLQDRNLCDSLLDDFLLTVKGSVGVAAAFGRNCVLSAIAVASENIVLFIQFTAFNHKASRVGRSILRYKILCNPRVTKLSFDMDRLCMSLHLDYRLHITHAIDLQSSGNKVHDRQTLAAFMAVLGDEKNLNTQEVHNAFVGTDSSSAQPKDVALRAWVTGRAGQLNNMAGVARINTIALDQKVPS